MHTTRAAVATVFLLGISAVAEATPNMIRLGYPTCASCHLSPQGGGLLNDYGKGIDAAQALISEEVKSPEDPNAYRRLPYEMKFSLGVDREPPELFFVPFDWLQTELGVDDLVTIDGGHTYRFTPGASVRLNRNVAVSFDTRDVFTGVPGKNEHSRTYSVQVSVKTVQ